LDGLSNEAHDTHHPITTRDYHESQKDEAKKNAANYLQSRIPKFLGYFERGVAG
jgi:glutathione S-transferase